MVSRFKRLTMFCNSGTGNTRQVARRIAEKGRQQGLEAEIIPIREQCGPKPERRSDSLTGVLTPTHGFTAPWSVIRWALRLPNGHDQRVFVCATRGGCKFGPVFTPGVASMTCFIIALILFVKGYRVCGVASFDMPSNWLSLHSGFKKKTAKAIEERTRPIVDRFAVRILSGKTNWLTINNLYEALWTSLLWWISVLYLIIGRICLAKLFFASNKCNQCGLCEKNCPSGAVILKGKSRKLPYWRTNCESCMRCMAYCPQKAIEVSHPWFVVLVVLFTVPFSHYLLQWFAQVAGWEIPPLDNYLHLAMNIAIFYFLLIVGYYLFYWLSRIPWVNTFLTYTTATHYYRRYHQHDTELTDYNREEY